MNLKARLAGYFARSKGGAVFTVVLGLGCWLLPMGKPLEHLSYDLPFLFSPQPIPGEVVIVEMDEASHKELEQEYGKRWDRGLHARLVEQLTADRCKMVVFDVWFADPGLKADDARLAKAIRDHGKVVLAANLSSVAQSGISGNQTQRPADEFAQAAAGWGIARVEPDTDSAIRRHYAGTELDPSLPWKAAAIAGAPITQNGTVRLAERWLRYYGPAGAMPSVSYHLALQKPAGFFNGKVVFIGGKPGTRFVGELVDEFRTPYTRRDGQYMPGVEIEATMFLNLLRGDWLSRLSAFNEALHLILWGGIIGFGLSAVRPGVGTSLAILGMIGVTALAFFLAWQRHVWFSWMVVVAVQIPGALIWSILAYARKLQGEKEWLEVALHPPPAGQSPTPALPSLDRSRGLQALTPAADHSPLSAVTAIDPASPPQPAAPAIPDHELIRCIGAGAYGEVWLARDVIGSYHAVKVVYRRTFKDDVPYRREFKGIQKFTPLSRSHAGFVNILHVGINEAAGHFYYVMELGDDEQTGQAIDPKTYFAKTLAAECSRRGAFPVTESLRLGMTLAGALQHLHQHGLIHRDIKPANIIFVNGVPKLADIGLVTDIGTRGGDATYVGTEGYMAPEGPGTAAADVFSLGKMLYEISTGRNRRQFPELPTDLTRRDDWQDLMRLNEVILKACEPVVARRYQSAQELFDSLLNIQELLDPKRKE